MKSVPSTELTMKIINYQDHRKSLLTHGPFGPNVKIKHSSQEIENSNSFLQRHIANYQVTVTFCVTDSSHATYCTGYKAFANFCLLANIDIELTTVSTTILDTIDLKEYKLRIIGAFMSYCAEEKGLHPKTVASYTTGLRDHWRREHKDLDIFNHPKLKDMRKALLIDWRSAHEELAQSATLPFTLDMMKTLRLHTNFNSIESFGRLVAAEMQFLQLMRVSELLPSNADHHVRGQDIEFEMCNSVSGNIFFIKPIQTHEFDIKDMISVHITVRSAKNDEDGEGFKYHHRRQVIGGKVSMCLATDMFNYSCKAKPLNADPFFSFQVNENQRKWLNYEKYNEFIKSIAIACGLNSKNFSTHSLRIGGATLLAAAGHPNHYIQRMGRWKSDAYMKYIHFAISSMNKSQLSLLDSSIYTMYDLLQSNPTAKAC
jgi:hypothetical protein